jgi:hypothetical protein
MNEKAPTRGQRLNLNLGGTDNSTSPQKLKRINHIRTLQEIADKWVDRGCYKTPGRALQALIGGKL